MLIVAMTYLLLIDGYNLIAPVAAPARRPTDDWLQRERALLVGRLVKHLPSHVRRRSCVVFDAANPPAGVEDRYEADGVVVRFSVGYPEADDLIEELIQTHSAPKRLAVVSSDHRIQAAAKSRGATAFDSQPWLDELLEDRVGLAPKKRGRAGQGSAPTAGDKPPQVVDREELTDWMREFGFDEDP